MQTDSLSDFRRTIAATSIEAMRDFFPFGSGFGSFVPIYAMYESPDTMVAEYVNHAHNDWIELILEGGLPFALVIVAFLVWLGCSVWQAWRIRLEGFHGLSIRTSAIIVILLLMHSTSDFPLRSRALLGLFAICCGFLAYGPEIGSVRSARKSTRQKNDNSGAFQPRQTDLPLATYFGGKSIKIETLGSPPDEESGQ